MSNADAPQVDHPGPPPLSWPPPGLERYQGALWRVIGLCWAGSIILVLPLLWALAVELPFYSLGPFEGNWELGLAIASIGSVLIVFAFGQLWVVMRAAARAADQGYGTLTIAEVLCDSRRDMGFLIQGKRHFGPLGMQRQASVTRARINSAILLLSGAVWLAIGFGISIVLAARGFVTPSGIWLVTVAPAVLMVLAATYNVVNESTTVRGLLSDWNAQEGASRAAAESAAWNERLDRAGEAVALGPGVRGEGSRFRRGATFVVVLFLVAFGPTVTIAITTAIGPILTEIAVPTFLSVQEMAGAAEVLRRYEIEKDDSVTPFQAGAALNNIAFVGFSGAPEPIERAPRTRYEQSWFPTPDFPDPFSETVASDLVARPFNSFSEAERAALRQAANHPAHEEFHLLARSELVDVVLGRWNLEGLDALTFQELPWPRFPEYRLAGLAQVARAAVEIADGDRAAAEHTLRELISTGFLLIDQGPTLLDNLVGVELTRMGANGLEGYYRRIGQPEQAEALAWARVGALDAARKARAGLVADDARALLQGVPDLVLDEDALRGLRWEYLATFNMLAPCINLQKMVFGPGQTYEDWRRRAERSIVRGGVTGERHLFDLVERGAFASSQDDGNGFLPRLLSLVLGGEGTPGNCASLIGSLQS